MPPPRLRSRLRHAWRGTVADGERYALRPDYRSRRRPKYFTDAQDDVVWQPDVYAHAAFVARERGSRRLIDVGCGTGAKLFAFAPEFDLVGLDYGPNLDVARTHRAGRWIEYDLERDPRIPVGDDDLRNATVIASDVIEHLRHPDRLLSALSAALRLADAAVLSTPERALTYGGDHRGPPGNPAHVREWTLAEFAELLRRAGLDRGTVGLTRSNDRDAGEHTILATLLPDGPPLAVASPPRG